MTRSLQPALHRALVALTECGTKAVVLDRYGVVWKKWSRRWWLDGPSYRYEESLGDHELAQRGPVKVIHEGVKP